MSDVPAPTSVFEAFGHQTWCAKWDQIGDTIHLRAHIPCTCGGDTMITKTPVTREITTHHDGFGLNDSIVLFSDQQDPAAGNGTHTYIAGIDGQEVMRIQFQHGPRNEPGSEPGVTPNVLLAILIDHLEGFQTGPYKNRENAIILTKLEECQMWTRKRTEDRAKRGVLGKNKV